MYDIVLLTTQELACGTGATPVVVSDGKGLRQVEWR